MRYRTPAALEMAIKEAAKASRTDTNRAIEGFYRHRLLCRVFSVDDAPFILKGGHSVLARTIDARATRDLDLLSDSADLGKALDQLIELSSKDLDDFVSFEFRDATPIKTDDEYRDGLNVRFDAFLGTKLIQTVSIDLVVDDLPCEEPDVVSPADRIAVEDVPVFDYRLYPITNALADKFNALFETHEGRPSSRVKDLVDILVYMRMADIDGSSLSHAVKRETNIRGVNLPAQFSLPDEWLDHYRSVYSKLANQANLPPESSNLSEASKQVASFYDPLQTGTADEKTWSPSNQRWS